ncbi:DUF3885 domain-containing protein [Bacillus paranthracis]|nr:DUF3885 domain-containing protein [Bacillus paranthracis]MCR6791562.1 DUF3885 domain-containing protein [Bacillus paranthracis]MED1166220.1 DUF3885 domain-containing protein [Bacillus paranthracis]
MGLLNVNVDIRKLSETIRDIYNIFNNWILDYDRKNDKTFN